jgi:uncharacterized protein (DUF2267 family)
MRRRAAHGTVDRYLEAGDDAMAVHTVETFERTVHVTNRWLVDAAAALGTEDRQEAYHAVRAALHALRDRLPVAEAAQLAAQLPTLLRGVFYEGWRPAATPERYHDVATFLERVAANGAYAGHTEASMAADATMAMLRAHVSAGEIADVLADLPEPIRGLLRERG